MSTFLTHYRIFASFEWFEKAVADENFKSDSDLYSRAEIFYNIGKFYSEINKREKEGTDSGEFYGTVWNDILEITKYINDDNSVISARVCQTVLNLLSRYSVKFRRNGVTQEEIISIISDIENKVYINGEIFYDSETAVSIARNFDTEAVRIKVEMAYTD